MQTYLMLSIVKRRMIIHSIPSTSFKFRSTMSSAPILVNGTPRSMMKLSALFTFSTYWIRIRGLVLYRPSAVLLIISCKRTLKNRLLLLESCCSYHQLNQPNSIRQVSAKILNVRYMTHVQLGVHPVYTLEKSHASFFFFLNDGLPFRER